MSGQSNNKLIVAILVALSALGMLIGYAGMRGWLRPGASSPLVDHPAPEVELPIVGSSERLALSSLRGHVVLFDFWASWCGPCRQSVPALNQVHRRFGTRIEMLGVNVESERPPLFVANAHRRFGLAFRSLQDQNWQAQGSFQVQSIPTLVLIDRQGVVRWVETGVPDADDLADRVEDLLSTQ